MFHTISAIRGTLRRPRTSITTPRCWRTTVPARRPGLATVFCWPGNSVRARCPRVSYPLLGRSPFSWTYNTPLLSGWYACRVADSSVVLTSPFALESICCNCRALATFFAVKLIWSYVRKIEKTILPCKPEQLNYSSR